MKFHLIGDVFTADRKTIENAAEANLQITLNAIRESQKYLRHVPDAARIKKLSDIPSLPFMTPAFVSQHSPPNDFSLVCNSRDSGVVLATGGTAGEKKHSIIHGILFTLS